MDQKELEIYLKEIAITAERIDKNGWSEAGSGNISLLLSPTELEELLKSTPLKLGKVFNFNTYMEFENLENCGIIITNTGSRMRELAKHPKPLISIIKVEKGNQYRIVLGNNNITSEWESHIGLLNEFAKSTVKRKAIVHIHSAEIIAFTHIHKNEKEINKLLKDLVHELNIFLPDGIGFIKHFKTGSKELADATIKKLEKYKIAFWENHGIISSAVDLPTALDFIEIINQAIKVFFYINKSK